MSEPTTAAGRTILRGDYRGNESYQVSRAEILAIEVEARGKGFREAERDSATLANLRAEARAAALDEARAAVQDTRRSLTAGPGQDATDVHIAWALGEALAAIDALREDAHTS